MSEPSQSDVMSTAYYDQEADRYDRSRGGVERARAAADAIESLIPAAGSSVRRCLDAAGGTGVVAAELAARGWDVMVSDLSAGMLAVAAQRLPGRAVLATADRLPVADGSVDLVTVIWMFNLVPRSVVDAVIAETARVLRPGGHLVASVDKELSHDPAATDLTDGDERVTSVAAAAGLKRDGTATFTGRTHWKSPDERGQVFRLAGFRRV